MASVPAGCGYRWLWAACLHSPRRAIRRRNISWNGGVAKASGKRATLISDRMRPGVCVLSPAWANPAGCSRGTLTPGLELHHTAGRTLPSCHREHRDRTKPPQLHTIQISRYRKNAEKSAVLAVQWVGV